MEQEIYQILKKHKLPLKKREEVLTDLLLLFSVSQRSEQLSCGCKEHLTVTFTKDGDYCGNCGKVIPTT